MRNMINGKVYVGQTKNFAQRKGGHVYAAKRGLDRPLYRSMRKHGLVNFTFEIIEECAHEVINDREQYWVAHYDSFNPEKGYNLTSGGNQGTEVADSTRIKLSTSLAGKAKSDKHRENISKSRRGWEGLRGDRNPNYGTHLSDSARKKLSDHAKKRVGEFNPNCRTTEDVVRLIKRRLAAGDRVCDIVKECGLSRSQVNRIKCNKQWHHVMID